jgi:hypothetical protein
MKLSEALETRKIAYKGSRKDYTIHDSSPNVLIIDKDYNVDGNGNSVLGFNLNYLDDMDAKAKKKLIQKVNKLDNEVLNLSDLKAFLRSILKIGDYKDLTKEQRIKRYREIIKEFPELKKAIRRYKHDAIIGGI